MSFPPRTPMGMPTMMGQGYGFSPVGMMGPMGMMPTQMMRPPLSATSPTSTTTTTSSTAKSKRLVPQEIPKDSKEDKPPVTTAFVGNISDRAPDAMVRQMLQRCGNVLSWKRVQGASGKLQAFGFCEYEDPEATLRCMRLLNSWKISDKTLVVKVDAKTKTLLDDYKKKKLVRENNSQEKRNGDKGDEEDESNGETKDQKDGLDEFTKREDRVAKAGLDAIMREYAIELEKEPSHEPTAEEKKEKRKEQRKEKKETETKDAGLDDMELEEGKKDLINREIQSFRDAHKGEEEKEAERNRERERRRREEERERERRERERDRERREKERDAMKRERGNERGAPERERDRTRSRSRDRTRSRSRDRERERHERERERELEDEEEAYERRKLEKKLREKEAGYQERLKAWEGRERKKTREYEKEREKEEERKAEESREARRLKEFLEDYDDERDDPKYYKGSALQRRLKEREKEMEADARDRQREKEEIDEIRRRLLEEGHPNLEEKMARIERERDEHLMPRLHNVPASPIHVPPSPPPPVAKPPPLSAVPPLPSPAQSPITKVPLPPPQQQQPQPQPQPQHQYQQQHPHQHQHQHQHPHQHQPPPQPQHHHHQQQQQPQPQQQHPQMLLHQEQPQLQQPPPPVRRTAELPPEPQPLPPPEYSTPSQSSPESDGCEQLPADDVYSEDSASQPFIGPATRADQQKAKMGFSSIKLANRLSESPVDVPKSKRKKLTVGDVFNQDDDDIGHGPKKRKLEPLDYSQEEKEMVVPDSDMPSRPTTAEEKRKCIKMLIEKIPTAKEELFAYTLDWNMVDTTLMDRRIKPWVNKKIVEYIGEEEPTLTDFICQKVMAHSAPQVILNDVAMVLDEEAEVFVVKMWRLLIYETEAKKAGLVK